MPFTKKSLIEQTALTMGLTNTFAPMFSIHFVLLHSCSSVRDTQKPKDGTIS